MSQATIIETTPPRVDVAAPETSPAKGHKAFWYALLLAAGTLALYAPTFHYGFIDLDDPVYVTANPLINHGLVWSHIVAAFNTLITGEWHPLTLISHMADVQMFGLHAGGHHFMNVAWHAFNVVLVFLLLRAATGYTERSATVAALFAAFPLNVEAVAWISERKSVLSMALMLLALAAYGWYVRRPGVGRYLLIAALFALGLMSKAMIITLPCALLLLDYWPLRRFDLPEAGGAADPEWKWKVLRLAAEKVPLLLISFVTSLITTRAMRKYGAVVSVDFYPLQWRVKNTIFSYLLYVVKGLWPARLAVFYPYHAATIPVWEVAGSGIVLIAITAAVWHYRRKRFLVTGWFWYVGTIVPVIGIVQVGHQAMADRYAYMPFLGIFVMLVWLGSELAGRVNISRVTLAAVTLAAIAGYAATTYAQIGYWRDTYTLWLHAAQVTSENAFAEEELGGMLLEKGRPDLAAEHFELAIRYLPRWSVARFDYGHLLQQEGRFPEAIQQYEQALAYESDMDEACATYTNLGAIFVQQKQIDRALAEFNAAIAVRPDNELALLNRGLVEYSRSNLDAATADFSRAVKAAPDAKAYFWLGQALQDKKSFSAAADAFGSALRIDPGMKEAQTHLEIVRRQVQSPPAPR